MHITSLSIRNFRGVSSFDATDLDQCVLLLGYNGVGKTTILHAMVAVLDGRVRYRDGAMATIGKRSVNVAELIGPAGNNASVSLAAEHDGHKLNASLALQPKKSPTLAFVVDGQPVKASDPDAARDIAYARMGINWPRLACGLQPAAYLIGDGVAGMIAELGGGLDRAALDALTEDHADWLTAFAAQNNSALDTLDTLAGIGDAAYTTRTAVNKELKQLETDIEREGFIPAPTGKDGKPLTVDQRPALAQQIARLRGQRDGFHTERGRVEASRTREQIDADIEGARKAVMAAQAALDAANETLQSKVSFAQSAYASAKAAAQKAVKDATAAREKHTAACNATQAAIQENSNATYAEHRAMNDLSGFKATEIPELDSCCPACRQKVNKAAIRAFEEWVADQVNAAQKRLDDANAHGAATLAALAPAREAESRAKAECDAAIRTSEAAARAERDAFDALLAAKQASAMEQEYALKRANEALSALEAEQPASRTIADVDADIAALESRIAKAQDAHDTLERIAALAGMNTRRKELQDELAHLNWAVTGFRDGQITRQLTGGEQANFANAVNAALEPFGYQIAIEGEAKHPRVLFGGLESDANGVTPMVPLAQVSNGEYVLAQWAVTAAFGGGLTFLDSIEQVDGINKPLLFDAIRHTDGGVWMTAANSKPTSPDVAKASSALGCRVIVVAEQKSEVAA